ncbi:hypothetical protein COO60DRAFT_1638487 [Scenedesmus sp. NREL 46B-D3]|nr:hypothetical protein COO60DRAFT_1638487 [Scenedesmus sp. NREL 46B-D3]
MDEAEAYNAAGNAAYGAGDFPTATECYVEAITANGRVAKYRTNLCNAMLKRGIAYYKALVLEQIGKFPEELAACEEGLRIHRHHADLESLQSRVHEKLRLAASAATSRAVVYMATVRDDMGHERAFRFEHSVDASRLARAQNDSNERVLIMQEVVMQNYVQMMLAQPWMCVSCQCLRGVQQRATKLPLHPLCYLHNAEPSVHDAGPTPTCSSQGCAAYATEKAREMVALGTRDAMRATWR